MSGFEVIGAVAASGQFLEQGIKVVKLIDDLFDKIANAPDEIKDLRGNIETLNAIAREVEASNTIIHGERGRQIAAVLARCKKYTIELENVLQSFDFEPDDKLGRKAQKAVVALVKESDICEILINIEREKSSLDLLVHMADAVSTKEGFEAVNTRLDSILSTQDDSSLSPEQRCLRQLFITDPEADRSSILSRNGDIVPGTCDWISDQAEFKSWLESEKGLLWISGGPGRGKTMLAVYLTELLENIAETEGGQHRSIVVYFFCDNKERRQNNATAILRGLLYRLIKKGASTQPLLHSWLDQQEKLFTESSFEALWGVFYETISATERPVVLLMDGLDECESRSLNTLATKLRKLFSLPTSNSRLKGLLLSRDHPDILYSYLKDFPHIALDEDSQSELQLSLDTAVQKYISSSVYGLFTHSRQTMSLELQQHIKDTLFKKSQGKYLWVSFIIKDLQGKKPSEVVDCLEDLPDGLNGVYERMINQIPKSNKELVLRLLRWVAFAEEPLNTTQLIDALEITKRGIVSAEQVLLDHISSCGHFISLNSDGCAKLVHQSAKDFLLVNQNKESSNLELADRCLSYIEKLHARRPDFAKHLWDLLSTIKGEINQHDWLSREFPLFMYAIRFWPYHARSAGISFSKLNANHANFFSPKSKLREFWGDLDGCFHACFICHNVDPPFRFATRDVEPPIRFAAQFGLTHWVQSLIQHTKLAKLGKRGTRWFVSQPLNLKRTLTPLYLAVDNSHADTVRTLLEHGADPNNTRPRGEPALHRCIVNGDYEIARDLLQFNSSVDAKGGSDYTALHCAIKYNRIDIVKLLLECGASLTVLSRQGETPLTYAAAKGGREMIDLLQKAGAGTMAQSPPDELPKALVAAAWFGNSETYTALCEGVLHMSVKLSTILLNYAAKQGSELIVRDVLARCC